MVCDYCQSELSEGVYKTNKGEIFKYCTSCAAYVKVAENYSEDIQSEKNDFDGFSGFIYNDEGECISGGEWDYPGSPYLSEDDDIY